MSQLMAFEANRFRRLLTVWTLVGPIPHLPWLGSNDALPLATHMETRLPWRPTRGSLTSPSYLVRNRSVVPDSLQPHEPCQALCPWDSPGRKTGVGSVPFSRGSSGPGIEPTSPASQADSLPSEPPAKPKRQESATTRISAGACAPGTRRGQGSHGQHHCHHDDHPLGKARGGDDDFYFRNSPSLNSLRVLSGRQGSLHVR